MLPMGVFKLTLVLLANCQVRQQLNCMLNRWTFLRIDFYRFFNPYEFYKNLLIFFVMLHGFIMRLLPVNSM